MVRSCRWVNPREWRKRLSTQERGASLLSTCSTLNFSAHAITGRQMNCGGVPGVAFACSPGTKPNFQLSADFTRSGENGTRRMRTPVASKMALAMAAATGRIEGSPAPLGAMSG